MKKLLVFALLSTLILSAFMLPPELPSSYYGEVTNGQVGQVVTTNLKGKTITFAYGDKVVYAMNVEGGVEGQEVIFYVNGAQAGTGIYHVGGNQNVNLLLPLPSMGTRPRLIPQNNK